MRFIFLGWNLFLAVIPYFLIHRVETKEKIKSLIIIGLCILFLPNSAYLITDLVHFKKSAGGYGYWFDLVLLFSFAWAGLLYSSLTIDKLRNRIHKHFGKRWSHAFTILIFPAIGYGLYLGRVERFNSWDVILHPISFSSDIYHLMTGPKGWMALKFALLFTALAAVLHVSLHVLNQGQPSNSSQ